MYFLIYVCYCFYFFCFFFQAEDGIRDHCVTGVQTCALPISKCVRTRDVHSKLDTLHAHDIYAIARIVVAKDPLLAQNMPKRSEERRVGKECRSRGSTDH